MSQVYSPRRLRWLIVGSIVAILMIGTVAIGTANSGSPDEIRLVLDKGKNEFIHGASRQKISAGHNGCSANADPHGAGLVIVKADTFNSKNKPVAGKLGLVNDGLGVSDGSNKSQDCGRVDYLGSNRSESLSFAVGPKVKNQVFTYVDFDLGTKGDAKVQFDFYQGNTNVGTQVTDINVKGKFGANAWFKGKNQDNFRVFAYPTASHGAPVTTPPSKIVPFDRVVITMLKGSVSVEGGAAWDKHRGYYGPSKPTIFYLTTARTEISIDTTVDGFASDDLGFVPAGSTLQWKFAVTNTGDLPLTKIKVTDDQGLRISGPRGDNGDGVLSAKETWYYTATSKANESAPGSSGFKHVATATGQSAKKVATATDTVTYFGTTLGIEMVKNTTGSNADGVYSGPGDGVLVLAGDKVTWTYTVTNKSNVPLRISVTDTPEGKANCPNTQLAPGASLDCTASRSDVAPSEGVARSDGSYTGGYTNSAVATGTHTPTGKTIDSAPDESGYFAMYRSLYIEVSNNGIGTPPVVSDPEVIWTLFARNDGNVEIELIVASQDLPDGVDPNQCDIASSLLPGEEASCEIRTTTVDGEQTTSFTVRGEDPLGFVIETTSGTVGYFGGLACGESMTSGGPGVDDTPLAGFVVGNSSKGDPTKCAVPAEVSTHNDPGADEQSVFAGAPSGYSWDGVTGLLTIEWDIEDPSLGLQPTLQTNAGVTTNVPICGGSTAVEILDPAPGDWMYRLVNNPGTANGTYPEATGGGDVCLVFTMTKTINYNGGVRTVTTEVFYLYNDPTLSRPR